MTIKRSVAVLFCILLLSLPVFTQKLVADNSFAPTLNGSVNFLEIQSDGKILIAGEFTTINGAASFKLARLNADGSLDTSFNANWLPGPLNEGVGIQMMKLLPNGKILLGGGLPYNGMNGGNVKLFRLNADGSFDTTLSTVPTLVSSNGSFQEIKKADQLPDGKILVCGYFTQANNNPKVGLARFNNDGSYDSTFTTVINDRCMDIAVQPDGKYIVAGFYTTINGNSSRGITRFNPDDSIDSSFNVATLPNSSTGGQFIRLQSDGSMFANVYTRIARLNPDGSLRLMLPGSSNYINDVAVQPNGKTLLAFDEDFTRANTDGTDDPSIPNFVFSGPGNPDYPKAVKVAADGKVIVGGPYTSFWTSATGTISRTYLARFTTEAIALKPKFDFDGDGRDDMAVYRPSEKIWYLNQSTNGFSATQFGLPQDLPVVADYDGDGKADIAVWRPEVGVWYWLKSTDSTLGYAIVGQPGDIPQQRNPNGGASKMIFRPSTAKWWTFNGYNPPSSSSMGVELPGDIPVRDDYDGDGFADLAVYRNGDWIYNKSSINQIIRYHFGLAGDKPVPADYDGDGRADFAVYRPSEGIWYIQKTTEGFYAVRWGLADDLPVPADYDGDGKTDIAIYRPSDGLWYEMRSTNSFHIEKFGLANDIPAQVR